MGTMIIEILFGNVCTCMLGEKKNTGRRNNTMQCSSIKKSYATRTHVTSHSLTFGIILLIERIDS